MVIAVLIVLLAAVFLWLLHYGYKLAFYYKDPQSSPYDYSRNDQSSPCSALLDGAIGEFLEASWEEVSILSHDGLKLMGRYYHNRDGAPLEIMCHGYKGNAIRDFCGHWRIAKAAGRNVLLIDQRCHGESEGHTITFGILEKRDVLGWIGYACRRFGDVPILLSGVSMGAATVLMVGGMELPGNVRGIVADCPYDAPANIIRKVLGQDMGMPVKFVYPLILLGGMVYGKFRLDADSPVEAVKRAKVPVLLIHGDADRFVPHTMSVSIYEAAPDTVEFHTIAGAGHALDYGIAPEEYTELVSTFAEKYL